MRIILFGDGTWATHTLRRLIQDGWLVVGLVARFHPTDADLLKVAKGQYIRVFCPSKVNDPEFVREIESLQPSLNLSIFYDQILHPPLLRMAPLGSINFHPGKLPNYRGRSVINWALLNGETEIGLTAHYMDENIDTGPIILQRAIPIQWSDTYSEVAQSLIKILPDLVVETLDQLVHGTIQPSPQAHLPGTYFGALEYEDTWIDWSENSRNIYNKIRAVTHPRIRAHTSLNNQEIIIRSAFYDPSWPIYSGAAGQVVGRSSYEGVFVKTGDSTILIKKVQIGDGDPQVPTWPIGTRLGSSLSFHLKQLQTKLDHLEQARMQISSE